MLNEDDTMEKEPEMKTTPAECAHVAVKLPLFWTAEPELWFFHVEAQFELARIKRDSTKLNYLLASIEPSSLKEIADILKNPNKTYDSVKNGILKRFGESDETKLSKLLGPLELGDRTPSQFLREMSNLAGNNVPTSIVRSLWIKKLPTSIQQILQVSETSDISKLAEMADKIHKIQPSYGIRGISHTSDVKSNSTTFNPEIFAIKAEIAALHQKIDSFISFFGRQSRSHYRFSSRTRSSSGSQKRSCFYHRKFGEKARKCIEPCNFKSQKDQGNS